MFMKRVIDEFLQKRYNDMNMCNYLPMLKYYKINFGYEMYLVTLPSKLRNILTKLHLSSHKLRIELDIYNRNRTPRELRYCILCNVNDVEDEYHLYLYVRLLPSYGRNILKRITIKIPVILSFVNY